MDQPRFTIRIDGEIFTMDDFCEAEKFCEGKLRLGSRKVSIRDNWRWEHGAPGAVYLWKAKLVGRWIDLEDAAAKSGRPIFARGNS